MQTTTRLTLFLAANILTTTAQAEIIERNLPIISYVSFRSLDPVKPLTVSGQLRVPAGTKDKVPAVVIVHASGGVDT
ncbi:hypothetical protein [Chitinimonas sp. BJB300]|uniref:hypothetical protein n=1 Tax=Chitinimonas sp. BJB300 TaxID=1559339 RepID=UPI000C0C81D0|nr:hypothetical protein [Chitinimonas sp. BJB300]PHV09963.1 hypothetical protein CSQ89_18770 [Chitinimonas sp. BJB300]TSJ90782.1 hypothetical protein FG002_000215 [Chitinimonas sp. BJB300]